MFQTSEEVALLHDFVEAALRLGAMLPVALIFAIALLEAALLPYSYRVKGAWVLAVVLCGVGATALLRWEQQSRGAAAADQLSSRLAAETAALHGLWSQVDELSKTLPPPSGEEPSGKFDNVDDALASVSAKLAAVKGQVAALKAGQTARTVDPATAAKLADYLRQYGSHRVVVSCAPGDVEAYTYANAFVDILKSAGWDAGGPEQTANVLPGPAIGVTVLDRDPSAPDAAKILLDALTQFDIPHAVGIAADYAIPDTATVELFVPKKP